MADCHVPLRAASGAVLLGACLAAPAFAQPAAARPDAGTVLEQSRELRTVPLRPSPATPSVVMPQRPGVKTAGIVPVAFRFAGNSRQRTEVLTGAVIQFVGKPLDTSNLRDLLNTVEEVYRKAGYAAVVAYLPEQQVRDGVVEIAIVEGRLGKVTVDTGGLRQLKPAAIDRVLGTLQAGVPITERDLERRLLLLQDLNGVTAVNSELKPGGVIGEGDLSVKVEDSAVQLRASLDLDNGGSEATGRLRAGANLRYNNPLGIGDQLGVRLLVQENELTILGRASYILPVGSTGTKVGIGYTRVTYELGGSFANLLATGQADSYSAFATHPFIRTRNVNLFGQVVADYKLLSDTVAATSPVTRNDKRVTSGKLGLFGDYRHANGALSLGSVLLSAGTVEIRGLDELRADQAGPRTDGRFSKLNYEFQTVQPLGEFNGQWSTSMLLLGQFASRNLTSAERLSLGGPSGVRAFPTGQLIVDEGMLFQGELRYSPQISLLRPETFGTPTVALFYDYGTGTVCNSVSDCSRGLAAPIASSNRISGAGLGVRLSKPGSHLVRLDMAWRTGGDEVVSGESRGAPRLWLQVVKDMR